MQGRRRILLPLAPSSSSLHSLSGLLLLLHLLLFLLFLLHTTTVLPDRSSKAAAGRCRVAAHLAESAFHSRLETVSRPWRWPRAVVVVMVVVEEDGKIWRP